MPLNASKLWYTTGNMKESAKLTNQILNFLYHNNAFGWRQNSTGIYDQKKGIYRNSSKKGVSDILAIHKGRLIAIEVKIGKDHLSSEQIGFLKSIERFGGLSIVAKDFSSFREEWNLKTCG